MVQEISKLGASARSIIHKKVRESRSVPTQQSNQIKADKDIRTSTIIHPHGTFKENRPVATQTAPVDTKSITVDIKPITGNLIDTQTEASYYFREATTLSHSLVLNILISNI